MTKKDSRITASRSKNRMNYEMDTICAILDKAHVCTVSYVKDNEPRALPTGHVIDGEVCYIHGSVKSHFFRQIAEAQTVCISAFLLDGMVLAKSGLSHTFNYRSVVIFGAPFEVQGRKEKNEVLAAFTDRYIPGRWDKIRRPSLQELDATMILGIRIKEGSAKIRQGPPNDLDKDKSLPVWSGVVPIETRFLEAVPDEYCIPHETPDYIRLISEKK